MRAKDTEDGNDKRQHSPVNPEHQRRSLLVAVIGMRVKTDQIGHNPLMAVSTGVKAIAGGHE